MLKVVVIDGNAISRNLLTSVLANGGYDVVGDCSTSSAGVASMIKLQPQLVCIDIGDTDEEGLSRLDAVHMGLPKALIFMVSAKFEPVAVQAALKRGVHGFIVKPFNPGKVLTSIRNAVLKIAKEYHKAHAGDGEGT